MMIHDVVMVRVREVRLKIEVWWEVVLVGSRISKR